VLFNLGGILLVRMVAPPGRTPTREEQLEPVPFQVEFERVSIPSGGEQMEAWYMPGSMAGLAARRASILLLPGSGMSGHADEALQYGPILTAAGYNVLAFSYRGQGRSTGTTRNGILLGLDGLIDDAHAALTYLRSRPDVGSQPVGAFGCSLGTGVALGLAARGHDLQALVLDSPWSDFVSSQQTRSGPWYTHIPGFWNLIEFWAGAAFQVDTGKTEPENLLRQAGDVPLFLLHRTADTVLNARQSERLYASATGPKQLWLVPGHGHCDEGYAADPEVRDQLAAFFGQYLLGRQGPGFVLGTVEPRNRELSVNITNQAESRLPLALTVLRPDKGEPPQEFRVWLEPGAQSQGYLIPIGSPPEVVSVLRHYRAQDRGPSWVEDLTPEAQAWRKLGDADGLAEQGKATEAVAAYKEAEALSDTPRVHLLAGAYFLNQRLLDDASDAFFKTLSAPAPPQPGIDPREWRALATVYTGRVYDLRGDRTSALVSYNRAKQFEVPDATYWADAGLDKPYGS
jgi:pimeloyl-ACP methyl ester carboxylesterase